MHLVGYNPAAIFSSSLVPKTHNAQRRMPVKMNPGESRLSEKYKIRLWLLRLREKDSQSWALGIVGYLPKIKRNCYPSVHPPATDTGEHQNVSCF